jgi:hypothetical protein
MTNGLSEHTLATLVCVLNNRVVFDTLREKHEAPNDKTKQRTEYAN